MADGTLPIGIAKRRILVAILGVVISRCGSSTSSSTEKAVAKTEQPPAPVQDDTALLPMANRTSARVVQNHILDKTFLPGGALGEYQAKGKKYELFIIRTDSNQKAAFLLLDLKNALQNPEYIAYMGGYFGTDSGTPVYTFAKLQYLAGVVGLPRDQADLIARQLAARLQ
jgi:hypothetical protein